MKLNLIINCAFCIVNCALLISCASNRPVVTTHTERIEERVMPVGVGADTIEITLCHPYGFLLNDTSLSGVCTPAYDISPPLGRVLKI